MKYLNKCADKILGKSKKNSSILSYYVIQRYLCKGRIKFRDGYIVINIVSETVNIMINASSIVYIFHIYSMREQTERSL